MNPLPFVTDETVASKRNGLRRAQQVNEADEIYTSLVLQRGLLRDLIHTSATGISDPAEAADVRLDLYMIVRDLAAAGGPGNPARRCAGTISASVLFPCFRRLRPKINISSRPLNSGGRSRVRVVGRQARKKVNRTWIN